MKNHPPASPSQSRRSDSIKPPNVPPPRKPLTVLLKTRNDPMLVGLGIVFLILACLTALVGVVVIFQPQLTSLFRTLTAGSTQALELTLPTQNCPPMGLTFGGRTFGIERVDLASGGGLPVPPESADRAFWVTGTGENRVLLLGTAAFGADAAALPGGQEATFKMENCNLSKYQLSTPLPASFRDAGLFDPSQPGLTVFIQTSPDGAGFILHGEAIEEQFSGIGSSETGSAEIQAEIGILEVLPSADGGTVQVRISLYNYGSASITLTSGDVQFVVEGSESQPAAEAQPRLPLEIKPGETVEIRLTFTRPSAGWGILKVFTVEYDLADFVE